MYFYISACLIFYQDNSLGFPGDSDSKACADNAGDPGSIPGLERSPGEGNGNPLQCPCLEDHGQRSLEGYVHGVTKELDMTEATEQQESFQRFLLCHSSW